MTDFPIDVPADFDTVESAGLDGTLRDGKGPYTHRDVKRQLGQCQWFLMCENDATSHVAHPILGDVPVCDRCRNFAEGK